MNDRVRTILLHAEQAKGLELEDIIFLLTFDEDSDEALLTREVAIRLGKTLVDGEGFIHAQIGVDSHPCRENCRFCSFAAMNKSNPEQYFEIDVESLRELSTFFSQQGVNLVSLMATAGLEFDTLINFVENARSCMNDNTVLLVNGPDFSLEQTQALRSAGAQAAYHAVRLGEGVITAIDPSRRLHTIESIHKAGLALMTGVEPVWQGVGIEEIADCIQLSSSLHPVWTGACKLSSAKGTAMSNAKSISMSRLNQIGAVIRLACGMRAPIGGVGGVIWVDAGADPRCRGKQDTFSKLEDAIAAAQTKLEERQWRVASQKSLMNRCMQAIGHTI